MRDSLIGDDITALPVGIPTLRYHLRITSMDEDVKLHALLMAAVEYCETITHQIFARRSFDWRLPCFPSREIQLPITPVSSVDSIKYIDTDGAEQDFATFDAVLDASDGWVCPSHGTSWPATRQQAVAVTMNLTAGAEAIPAAAAQAIKFVAAHNYANPEGDKPIPQTIKSILATLKVKHTL